MDNTHELLTPDQASDYLRTPAATIQWWRTRGRGPRYVKLGRRVFYRRTDLDAFIQAGEREPAVA